VQASACLKALATASLRPFLVKPLMYETRACNTYVDGSLLTSKTFNLVLSAVSNRVLLSVELV
jgi:hypothetical protein